MRHFGCLMNVYLVKKLQTSHPPQLIMKGQFISFEDYIWSNGSHWISNSFNCHIKNSPQKCGPLLTEKSNLILSVVKGNFWLLQNCMQLNSQSCIIYFSLKINFVPALPCICTIMTMVTRWHWNKNFSDYFANSRVYVIFINLITALSIIKYRRM